MFKQIYEALVVRKNTSGFEYCLEKMDTQDLPSGDLLVKVNYSNINFKDAMSCQGNPSITRRFPHTPGIDACGTIVESSDENFAIGDSVLIICKPMGLNSPGGFGGFVRIPSSWAFKIDKTIDQESIMAIGTAGFTAALAVEKIIESNKNNLPNKVVVSGSRGGVGIIAIMILKHIGVRVSALTTSKEFLNDIKSLGVDEIIIPDDLIKSSKQNLAIARWNAAIDVTGGNILSSLIKSIEQGGSISVVGNVQSTVFETNVLPFILRGISLNGINAEMQDDNDRKRIIKKITTEWMPDNLSNIYSLISLDQLPEYMDLFIKQKLFGRVVVKLF